MIENFRNWLKTRFSADEPSPGPGMKTNGMHRMPVQSRPRPQPRRMAAPKAPRDWADANEVEDDLSGKIESLGPGKNVLIRNKFVREDTGTHESLTILDDSLVETGEETGIDPYNTGGFDRSKNWDTRFRK